MKRMFTLIVSTIIFALGVAVAAAPAPVVISPVPDPTGLFGGPLGAFLAPLAGLAFTALLGTLTTWVYQKTAQVKNEQLRQALDVLAELALMKVAELASSVDLLKAASPTGTLSPAEKAAAQQTAIQEIWSGLPTWAQSLIRTAAGSEQLALDNYVLPKVEQAVGASPRLMTLGHEVARGRAADNEVLMARRRLGLAPLSPRPR